MPRTIYGSLAKDIIIGTAATNLFFLLFGYLGVYVVPIPIIFYRLKLGRSNGSIIPLISFSVMAFIFGSITFDLIVFFELLLLGFVAGELLELQLSIERTILYTLAMVITSGFICLILYSRIVDASLIEMASASIDKSMEAGVSLIRKINPSEPIQAAPELLEKLKYIVVRLLPAKIIQEILIVTWVSVLLVKPLVSKKGMPYPNFGQLKTWKAPEILVWGFIGSAIMMFLPSTPFMLMGTNSILILLTIYFFQGIAVFSFYFDKINLPRFFKYYLFGFVFIFLHELLILFVGIVGLIDIWLDFRKLEHKMNTQEN